MPRYRSSEKIDALLARHKDALEAINNEAPDGDISSDVLIALTESADETISEDFDTWIDAYNIGARHAAMRKTVWGVGGLGHQGDTFAFWYGSERSVLARIRAALAEGLRAGEPAIDGDE